MEGPRWSRLDPRRPQEFRGHDEREGQAPVVEAGKVR